MTAPTAFHACRARIRAEAFYRMQQDEKSGR
jgi:hypothetical protein